MKYVPPVNGDAGNANRPYLNANPGAGVEGSIPSAAAFEHPMRELLNLITYAGLTPTDADLTQVRQAVSTMIAAASSSGNNKYMKVQHQTASGVAGGACTLNAWTQRPLNTVVVNNIPNAYLDSNKVVLPGGTYLFRGLDTQYYGSNMQYRSRLRNIGDGVYYYGETTDSHIFTSKTHLSGLINIAFPKEFEIQYYRTLGGNVVDLGNGFAAPGVPEIYAQLDFLKVA